MNLPEECTCDILYTSILFHLRRQVQILFRWRRSGLSRVKMGRLGSKLVGDLATLSISRASAVCPTNVASLSISVVCSSTVIMRRDNHY
jgi:hypothetical protein